MLEDLSTWIVVVSAVVSTAAKVNKERNRRCFGVSSSCRLFRRVEKEHKGMCCGKPSSLLQLGAWVSKAQRIRLYGARQKLFNFRVLLIHSFPFVSLTLVFALSASQNTNATESKIMKLLT